MKRISVGLLAALVVFSPLAAAYAQPYQERGENRREEPRREERRPEERRGEERRYDQNRYREVEQHRDWRRGEPVRREEWEGGRRLDYREHGLYAPPPGYEWREVGGAVILGAIATGIIGAILTAPGY
jgi:Ni/Co efflux regulator RcnB